jgi:hypothetical protein
MLEYKSSGASETRFATTEMDGSFGDSFVPGEPGPWRIQAFWPGDAMHAPAESAQCRVPARRGIGPR